MRLSAVLAFLILSGVLRKSSGQNPAESVATNRDAPSPRGKPMPIMEGTPFLLDRAFPEAAGANMLTFRLHSERVTGARVTLKVLAPDVENSYSTSFAVQWKGWNDFQLEKEVFHDRNGDPSWGDVRGIQFSGQEGPLPPTALRLADVQWSHDTPAWELEHGERMIEASYSRIFTRSPRWRPAEDAPAEQRGEVGTTWASVTFTLRREPDRALEGSFWRPFHVDISDCQAVRIQAAIPAYATIGMSARIDGEIREVWSPQPGTGYWHEYRGPIDGKTLEALYLHCGEGPDKPPGDPPTDVVYTLHFVTLETSKFGPPQYPDEAAKKALPPNLKTREPLMEAGLPEWLYFGREDVPAIRERVRKGESGLTWEEVIEEANKWLGDDPSPYAGGYWPITGHEWERPWYHCAAKNRNWDSQACACAFAYLLTEDVRYAEQAKRYLLAAGSLVKWNYGMISRYPVGWGGHGGPFAEASYGSVMVLAYNWIYNTLSDKERRTIEEAMLYKSWYWLNEYIDRADYIRSMNQGPWFNWGALTHALMLRHSHPFLAEQIDKYEANIRESIDLCYQEDGSNTEGPAYWGATTRFITYGLPLLAHERGRPLAEYVPEKLKRSIETPIYLRSMARDGFYLLGINDASYQPWWPGATGLFFATLLEDPSARWAGSQTSATGDPYMGRFGLEHVLRFLWHAGSGDVQRPKLVPSRRFDGSAGIVLRSGWDVGDVFFCMQTGVWGTGHQHPDKNSFVLEAYRERLCPDAGIGRYGGATTASYQRTKVHNTITINGADQVRADPKVLKFTHADDCDIIESDVTANYPGATKVIRRVLFTRPRYFVISDEVTTAEPASIEFNLHTFSEIVANEETVRFDGENADMLIKVIAPDRFQAEVSSMPSSTGGGTLNRLQISPNLPVNEMHYVTLLYPLRKHEDQPEITSERSAKGVTIRVEDDIVTWTPGEGLKLE